MDVQKHTPGQVPYIRAAQFAVLSTVACIVLFFASSEFLAVPFDPSEEDIVLLQYGLSMLIGFMGLILLLLQAIPQFRSVEKPWGLLSVVQGGFLGVVGEIVIANDWILLTVGIVIGALFAIQRARWIRVNVSM